MAGCQNYAAYKIILKNDHLIFPFESLSALTGSEKITIIKKNVYKEKVFRKRMLGSVLIIL